MTQAISARLEEMLAESGAFLSGHFILSSGRHSGNYLQCALLCARPDFCGEFAADLAAKVRERLGPEPCDLVMAPAIGGVVIGYEMARQLNMPGYFCERDKESVMQLRRGFKLEPGQRVLIAEDVITTGGSVLEVAEIIQVAGAEVVGYACLFDRSVGKFEPGPPVVSLSQLTFPTYEPEECPLCKEDGPEAVKPGSRK